MLTCEKVMAEEYSEKYLLNQLPESDCDAFEQHFFECERCCAEVEAQQVLCEELKKSGNAIRAEALRSYTPFSAIWIALPAAFILMAVAGILLRRTPSISKPSTVPVTVSPARSPRLPEEAAAMPQPTLVDLAKVSPPPYRPTISRGVSDEATRTFRSAMNYYARADYRHAVQGLRVAERLNPRAAYVGFYLGASYLLDGQVDAAIEQFRKTASLPDSPYAEEALFYQAKAYLRKGDVSLARRQLEWISRTSGTRAGEASELLRQVQALPSPPR